ncbi:MAG TPA: metalloregulator ArsR/SmtB family transcription factor [Solirubrobacteraceae bacterium]
MTASGATLAALAEPTRRQILERLRVAEASVGELADRLALSQPTTSKHLRVLRDAGLVSSTTAAQRRIYRIEPEPLQALDAWLEPYRRLWTRHLDALERHLDDQED